MSRSFYTSGNYKPSEFAEEIGVSVITLQRWDNAGVLKANRTPTGRRYYTHEQLRDYRKGKYNEIVLKDEEIPGFGEWLLSKYDRNYKGFPFKYFVSDIDDDMDFPISETDYGKIADYLIKSGGTDTFYTSFEIAFKEYKKEFEKEFQKRMERKLKNKDFMVFDVVNDEIKVDWDEEISKFPPCPEAMFYTNKHGCHAWVVIFENAEELRNFVKRHSEDSLCIIQYFDFFNWEDDPISGFIDITNTRMKYLNIRYYSGMLNAEDQEKINRFDKREVRKVEKKREEEMKKRQEEWEKEPS